MTGYSVRVAPAAKREIKKLTTDAQIKIVKCLEKLGVNPRPPGVEKLSENPKFLRMRVGDYRVIYHIEDHTEVLVVVVVRHRKDAYRDLDKLDMRLVAARIAPLLTGLAQRGPGN